MKQYQHVSIILIALFAIAIVSIQAIGTAADDKINTNLLFPDIANFGSDLYGGYLDVSNAALGTNRSLYYLFAEMQGQVRQSNTQPIIVWLNGGPGCSSLGSGAGYENGPWIFGEMENTPSYTKNQYSWNQLANVMYLETPAGVGFSLLNDNVPQNDMTVGQDNVNALVEFLTRFGWLGQGMNEVFIAGESYAGVYIPHFAYFVHLYNRNQTDPAKKINFKGYAVGNGCTDPAHECQLMYTGTDDVHQLYAANWVYIQNLYNQQFVNEADYTAFNYLCSVNYMTANGTSNCNGITNSIFNTSGLNYNNNNTIQAYVNWYDIYRTCDYEQPSSGKGSWPWPPVVDPNTPCIDATGATEFFNNKANMINMHATTTPTNGNWSFCVDAANEMHFTRAANGSYWIYPILLTAPENYRVMVYSGNTDNAVPIVGTRRWIDKLRNEIQMTAESQYLQWYNVDPYQPIGRQAEHIAFGTVETYGSAATAQFTFVTANGVGHMVPQWNRQAGFEMIRNFIYNTDFNTDPYHTND